MTSASLTRMIVNIGLLVGGHVSFHRVMETRSLDIFQENKTM